MVGPACPQIVRLADYMVQARGKADLRARKPDCTAMSSDWVRQDRAREKLDWMGWMDVMGKPDLTAMSSGWARETPGCTEAVPKMTERLTKNCRVVMRVKMEDGRAMKVWPGEYLRTRSGNCLAAKMLESPAEMAENCFVVLLAAQVYCLKLLM